MRADGTQRKQLTWSKLGSAEPDWSPNGREIAFTTSPVNATNRGPRIFAMNAADGTGKRKITVTPGRRSVWSPDGKRLLVESVAPVKHRRGSPRRPANYERSGPSIRARPPQLHSPRWSADATQLVFIWDNRSSVPLIASDQYSLQRPVVFVWRSRAMPRAPPLGPVVGSPRRAAVDDRHRASGDLRIEADFVQRVRRHALPAVADAGDVEPRQHRRDANRAPLPPGGG
jgi:dipeptidyl aminopeptidase/acylaminoacyl peptidase